MIVTDELQETLTELIDYAETMEHTFNLKRLKRIQTLINQTL